MSEFCEQIRPDCAHTFQELILVSAEINSRTEAMDAKLDDLGKAVLGNGEPTKGLAARVERLEAANKNTWKVVGVCVAVAAALVAILSVAR